MLYLLVFSPVCSWSQALQTIPVRKAHVIDQTSTLSPAQQEALEHQLASLELSRGAQVVVLMVASTQPEDIAAYTQRVGASWKIGRKNRGDGVLLVVTKNDLQVRIAPTQALEGAIPDLVAKQIIDERITPRFQQGQFAEGLDAAVKQLTVRITGQALPPARPTGFYTKVPNGWSGMHASFLVLLALPFVVFCFRRHSLVRALGRILAFLMTSMILGLLAAVLTRSLLATALAIFLGFLLPGLLGLLGTRSLRSSSGRGAAGWGVSSREGGSFSGGGASGTW